jgi:hypothetical protein
MIWFLLEERIKNTNSFCVILSSQLNGNSVEEKKNQSERMPEGT